MSEAPTSIQIREEESYNALVKVCVSYLNTMEANSAEQEAMTLFINMHMGAIKRALEYVDELPIAEGTENTN